MRKMKLFQPNLSAKLLFSLVTLFALIICVNTLQLVPVQSTTTTTTESSSISDNEITPSTSNRYENELTLKQHISNKKQQLDSTNGRIVLSDPMKTLLKSTTRLMIDLSPLPRFVSTDTVMDYVGRVANKLSKTTALVAAIKVTAFVVSAISVLLFWFPATLSQIIGTIKAQQRRYNEWEQFYRTSMHPDAILDTLARSSDQAMDRLGFQDRSCRERSLCEIGDIVACSFPTLVSQAREFAASNLPETFDASRNRYSRALAAGLNRTDCAGIYEVSSSSTCSSLLEWVNTTVWGPKGSRSNKTDL